MDKYILYLAYSAITTVSYQSAVIAAEGDELFRITDTKQVYTNGTVLVPMFRVRQALKDKAYNGLMEG